MNKYRFDRLILALCAMVCLWGNRVSAQPVDTDTYIPVTLKEYLELVVTNNLEYAAERYNVSMAEAEVQAVKVFHDPTLTFEWAREGGENAYTTELEHTVEFGVRRARIKLAKSEHTLEVALLNDYLRNLLADATQDYLNAMKQNHLYEVTSSSYQMVKKLAQADSLRLSTGSINRIDALQSRLEAGMLHNELMGIDAERKSAFINLSNHVGIYRVDTLYFPAQEVSIDQRDFTLSQLLDLALANRSDLEAARAFVEYSRSSLMLTRAERRMDLELKVGATNSQLNSSYFSPTSAEIMAGFAIPLKFSNLNKGELKVAQYGVEQSELLYKQAELTIKNEVYQAFYSYQSMQRQLANFNVGLLEQAQAVLDGREYSYTRGESSLLEVLDAQRTHNELHMEYFETLFEYQAALVELERACGCALME